MGNTHLNSSMKGSIVSKQVSFAKGLRFASPVDKWQYLTHPQKWQYIRKEAWLRKPVECEVSALDPEAAKPWDDPAHLMKALQNQIWKLQAQWRQINLEEQQRIRNYFNETQAMKNEQSRIDCFGDKVFSFENQKEVEKTFKQLVMDKDFSLV